MGFALSDLQITSTAFQSLDAIPKKHTGEGENVSPALSWSKIPAGVRSLAVVCHDPDAPLVTPGTYGFVHWVIYNIPAATAELPEGVKGYTGGVNSKGEHTYTGPMPPEGHGTHHYYFWLLALDAELDLEPGLSMWELFEKVEPHVIGMNRLVGTYSRK